MPYAQFSASAEAAFRSAYALLLLLQLIWTWPHARRFFTSARYGGYIEPSPLHDRLHTPATAFGIVALWTIVALGLLTGTFVLAASVANFALAYYFFVRIRWRTILRGMGAPGHINYWIAALLTLLAIGDAAGSGLPLRDATVVAFRIDFAGIMIFAGVYKLSSGYARGDGFERGLVNPWWGWWSALLRNLSPRAPFFSFADHAAYVTEIACGIAFFVPAAAPYAALLLGLSFLGIGAVIRLTFLAEMVAVCCLLYVWPGSPVDALFARAFHPAIVPALPGAAALTLGWAFTGVLVAYVAMLPFAYACMVLNFYFRRRLPEPVQHFFDAWNRFFGLILWRVFTNDIINFYCKIYRRPPQGPQRAVRQRFRFSHVGEFICLASLFTTLKYYPNDPALFEQRLNRYVRSLPPDEGEVVFRYYRIEKTPAKFAHLPVAEFVVDPQTGIVRRDLLDPAFDPKAVEPGSPIHSYGQPGSYAPVGRS